MPETSARHTGDLMGVAPSGKDVTIQGIDIPRISGGRVAEVWQVMDAFGMLAQIGAYPPLP